jgi:GntR family transcriptional regulator
MYYFGIIYIGPKAYMKPDLICDAIDQCEKSGPLYRQVADGLKTLIESGALAPDEQLPSERELAEVSGASRVTIRMALSLLAERKLVSRRRGSGTYVAQAGASHITPPVTSLTDELSGRGHFNRTIWLSRQIVPATFHDRASLKKPDLSRVIRLERLRLVDERPMSVERSIFTPETVPDVSLVDQSIYSALRANRSLPARVVQEVSAVNMVPIVAERLQALPASAALKITRWGYDAEDSIVEFTEALFRPDAYSIVSEFGGYEQL